MMPCRVLTHAERVAIIDRHLAGETLQAIAMQLQISFYTARTYWRHYQRAGWDALAPAQPGPPATGPLSRAAPRLKYVLLRLKRQHRGWGVDKLRLELTRRPSLRGHSIPQRSSLAAYLARFGPRLRRPRRLRTQRPSAPPLRPTAPHQVWQIDFTGDTTVAGIAGQVVPLMVCDAASGAPLAGQIHTIRHRGRRSGISARTVQADLRRVFAQWGLPAAIRLDRDPVFVGSPRLAWPGLVLLWLVGLGVQPIINRAFRPTDNAIVERNHQTWRGQVVVDQHYTDVAALQAATEQAFADRRTALPSRHAGCDGRPFLTAFPSLEQVRQAYRPSEEAQLFELARVDAYLAAWRWQRRVDSTGKISLNNRNYSVGRAYQGQVIRVQFEHLTRACVCTLADGQEVGRFDLPELHQDYLLGQCESESGTGGCN